MCLYMTITLHLYEPDNTVSIGGYIRGYTRSVKYLPGKVGVFSIGLKAGSLAKCDYTVKMFLLYPLVFNHIPLFMMK